MHTQGDIYDLDAQRDQSPPEIRTARKPPSRSSSLTRAPVDKRGSSGELSAAARRTVMPGWKRLNGNPDQSGTLHVGFQYMLLLIHAILNTWIFF